MAIIIPIKNIYGIENEIPYTNSIKRIDYNVSKFKISNSEGVLETLTGLGNTSGATTTGSLDKTIFSIKNTFKQGSIYCYGDYDLTPSWGKYQNKKLIRTIPDQSTVEYNVNWTIKIGNLSVISNTTLDWNNPIIDETKTETLTTSNYELEKVFDIGLDGTQFSIKFTDENITISYIRDNGSRKEEYIISADDIIYGYPYKFTVHNGLKLTNTKTITIEVVDTSYLSEGFYVSISAKFIPLSVNVYGEYSYVDKYDSYDASSTYTYGNETLSISNNQLFQGTNSVSATYMFNKTIEQYKSGKENATILCSISDYYDDEGNLIIAKNGSTNKISFELYDEVVPMVNNGTPLSLSFDGKAKTFALLGSKIYYDGAVWQELSLQEKSKIPYIGGTENLKYEVVSDGNYCRCVGGNEDNSTIEITEFIGFLPNVCYVKGIADYAFKHKQNLNQISLPKTIKYLGRDAFANCYNVKNIYYDCEDAIVVDADYQPFYRVGENADGTVFRVGTNVKKIPDNLFASEESPYARISEIYFYPNSQCESIGNTAFYECKDIQRVTAPVKTIGRLAFAYNTNLKELSLKNIIDIGDAAFAGCSLLYEIHFGKDLKHIGKNAFNNCYNFSDIYYEGSYEDWQKVVIESGNGNSSEAGSFMYTVLSPSMHFNSF